MGAITWPLNVSVNVSCVPANAHLNVSWNSPNISEQNEIFIGCLSEGSNTPASISKENFLENGVLLGNNDHFVSISPLFSIVNSHKWILSTNISPKSFSLTWTNAALGPIPVPVRCSGNLSSWHVILQNVEHEYWIGPLGLNVTVTVISPLG